MRLFFVCVNNRSQGSKEIKIF